MIGIIADIHANLPALQAVLDKLEGVEKIICLGDVVGYGPYAKEVIELVKSEKIICVMGNHDYAVLNGDVLNWFNPYARQVIEFTRRILSPEYISFLNSLPWKIEDEFLFVHGSPRDPLFEYIFPGSIPKDSHKLVFIGHSHIQFAEKNFVNPGSVGQPRDGDSRAAYAVFNGEKVKFYRVRYNIDEVAEEIERVGLPYVLAERLYEGR